MVYYISKLGFSLLFWKNGPKNSVRKGLIMFFNLNFFKSLLAFKFGTEVKMSENTKNVKYHILVSLSFINSSSHAYFVL